MTTEKLKTQIREQRQAIEEFKDAIALLKLPARLQKHVNLAPLEILQSQQQQATGEKERAQQLRQYESALAQAEQHLATLEAQLQEQESKEAAAIAELTQAADAFNRASEELCQQAIAYLSVSKKVSSTLGGDIFLPLERDIKALAIQVIGSRAILETKPLN